MSDCPTCGAPTTPGEPVCKACGSAVEPDELRLLKTGETPRAVRRAGKSSVAPLPGKDFGGAFLESQYRRENFVPGAVLDGRYRLVARLGKGGMGEVFRADDLTLGSEVALKFLADVLNADPTSRERLIAEVRVARRVSHPNVCRVHDVGEFEGRRFISMEYIDGEDLSTLFKRIGRLPGDKALQLARQVCDGLRAAHDQGVLHRDLKPTNILIDGRGQARLADFGLAAVAEDIARQDGGFVGTPAYMSPEQLDRKPHTVKSDLYALGLVMYELFSGKPVFRPKSLDDLYALHAEPKARLSEVAPDIDPAVEAVIMRCIAEDPAERPASVAAVLAALPITDPLEAALRAGQTPSPELVAAAGQTGVVRAWTVAAWVFAVLAGIALASVLHERAGLLPRVPLQKSLAVLDERSRDILSSMGYRTANDSDKRVYQCSAFDLYEELLWTMADMDQSLARWDRLDRGRPAPVDYWYRQSKRPIVPANAEGKVSMWDPPQAVPGMVSLRLDPLGRLRQLEVVTEPERVGGDIGAGLLKEPDPSFVNDGAPNWGAVFKTAGLRIEDFASAAPERVPPVWCETRHAWRGFYPEYPDEPISVEMGAIGRHVVSFRIVEEKWKRASTWIFPDLSLKGLLGHWMWALVRGVAVVGGAVLAWRNLRNRRGDRAGALTVALLALGMLFIAGLLTRDHPGSMRGESNVVSRAFTDALVHAVILWLMYIALEPAVRRWWPSTIISWQRVLAGRLADPLVSSHVVAGMVLGAVAVAARCLDNLAPGLLGRPPSIPLFETAANIDALASAPAALGVVLASTVHWAEYAMLAVLGLVICKFLFRSTPAAALLFGAVQAALFALLGGDSGLTWASLAIYALLSALTMWSLVRFGALAAVVAGITYDLLLGFPLPARAEAWYLPVTASVVGTLALAAIISGCAAAGAFVRRPRPFES